MEVLGGVGRIKRRRGGDEEANVEELEIQKISCGGIKTFQISRLGNNIYPKSVCSYPPSSSARVALPSPLSSPQAGPKTSACRAHLRSPPLARDPSPP